MYGMMSIVNNSVLKSWKLREYILKVSSEEKNLSNYVWWR